MNSTAIALRISILLSLLCNLGACTNIQSDYEEPAVTVTSFRKERIQYALETKLDVGAFHPAIRVKNSGEISLQPSP